MRSTTKGFTYIELIVGITVFTVAALALGVELAGSIQISNDSRNNTLGKACIRNLIAELRQTPLPLVPALYGPGGSRQTCWCTSDGTIVYTDPGDAQVQGEIHVFDVESDVPEEFSGDSGGLDLNGDGTISTSAITNFRILPVQIELTIGTTHGTRSRIVDLFLGNSGSPD